jgi:diaminopimelate epimerase
MSKTSFLKMHGLGNDFLIFDARTTPLALTPTMIRKLSHRYTGIGCDQFIVLEPSTKADVFMRIYNQDGGEVEACGNASRCVAVLIGKLISTIETVVDILGCTAQGNTAVIDMGSPKMRWDEIPLAQEMDTLKMPVGWEFLANPVAVNVGNPHVVFFVAKASSVDLARLGPLIERDGLFPKRINVNIAEIIDRQEIKLRVWERGAGLTLACGTGACATTVAAIRRGLTERRVSVHLPGGVLSVELTEDNRMLMGGPVALAFEGVVDLSSYA